MGNDNEKVEDLFSHSSGVTTETAVKEPVIVEPVSKEPVSKAVEPAGKVDVIAEPTVVEPPTTPVPSALPVDTIKEIVRSLQEANAPKPVVAAPQPRSLYKVKAEDMDKFITGGEETAQYVNQMIEGVMNNMAELILPYIEGRIAPLQAIADNEHREKLKQEFSNDYEDLKDYIDVAEEVANRQVAAGKTYDSKKAFFNDVATETRKMKKDWEVRLVKSGLPGATPIPQKIAPPQTLQNAPRSTGGKKIGEIEDLFS